MSMINPLWMAAMRRQWPLVGAVIIFVVLTFVHLVIFRPAAGRYESALRRAGELGLALDPNDTPEVVPPRVFALLAANALATEVAREHGDSGQLGATLLEDLSKLLNEYGLETIVTEPGPTTQQAQSIQVRAHLRLRGTYDQFVAFTRGVVESDRLYKLDRFTLQPDARNEQIIDLWMSQYILKHSGALQ